MRALNMVTDEERELKLTTEHSASSYGIPVLVDVETGEAIDAFSFACYTITEATEDELHPLQQWGWV
jgi:hypothetical protein